MREGETVGERIKRCREDLGLTQSQLAEKADLAASTIGNIEQDRQGAGKNIDLIAGALGKSAKYLRTGADSSATIPEASLSQRETRLIQLFRSMGNTGKGKIEAYAAGLQGSAQERRPRVKQTAQEIQGIKTRRSG